MMVSLVYLKSAHRALPAHFFALRTQEERAAEFRAIQSRAQLPPIAKNPSTIHSYNNSPRNISFANANASSELGSRPITSQGSGPSNTFNGGSRINFKSAPSTTFRGTPSTTLKGTPNNASRPLNSRVVATGKHPATDYNTNTNTTSSKSRVYSQQEIRQMNNPQDNMVS